MARNRNERTSTSFFKRIFIFLFSFLGLAFQILLYVGMFVSSLGAFAGGIFNWFYIAGEILGFISSLWVIYRENQASYRIAWVFLILMLPYFFVLLYIFNFYSRRLPKKKQKHFKDYLDRYIIKGVTSYDHDLDRVAKLISHDSYFNLVKNTVVSFFKDPLYKHLDMLSKMKEAKNYIFIETFILSSGQLFEELYEVLKDRANCGVEIKILYDDVGSRRCFKRSDKRRLKKLPNLTLVRYNPFGFNLSPGINYRDHRKITIIDGIYAYCGGDNLASEYVHYKERFGFWRDNVCLYEGDAVYSFLLMFASMWCLSHKEYLDLKAYYNFNHGISNNNYVLPFGDGPNKNTFISHDAFISLINSARESVYISTPYLIIDDELINALIMARKANVDVKVLTPGIPDKKAIFQLTRAHYKQLLINNVEIYEFTPGFNHAKNLIIDSKYAFLGTINFDYRSMYLHYECGAIFNDKQVIQEMRSDFLACVLISRNYTYKDYKKRNIISKFLSFVFKILSPML